MLLLLVLLLLEPESDYISVQHTRNTVAHETVLTALTLTRCNPHQLQQQTRS